MKWVILLAIICSGCGKSKQESEEIWHVATNSDSDALVLERWQTLTNSDAWRRGYEWAKSNDALRERKGEK